MIAPEAGAPLAGQALYQFGIKASAGVLAVAPGSVEGFVKLTVVNYLFGQSVVILIR
jgi:hypothetical protein